MIIFGKKIKNEVLEELPEKTEIILELPLSEDERAFYEAIRETAVENLEKNVNKSKGSQHLSILAEIMKLRRACCTPKLVLNHSKIKSSKLEKLKELLIELKENNHKVLIFSQFVGYLKIIKNLLDKENISYQYLDGSTPQKKRKKRVTDFQAGKSDCFLISLKAGGTGLNLTAANYVIHTDPWWNPAVEDQASDRVHRIGQKQPVTIYKLVTTGTIEEKIIALHKTKRDLADSLLDGTDKGGKISTEALIKLLKNG